MRFPILINESFEEGKVGDLMIFSSDKELNIELEPWYAQEPYFAYDVAGKPLRLCLSEDGLLTLEDTDREAQPALVRDFLMKYVELLHLDRAVSNGMTTEDLMAYVKKARG